MENFELDLDVLLSSFTEKMNLLKRLKDEFNKGGCESHQNCVLHEMEAIIQVIELLYSLCILIDFDSNGKIKGFSLTSKNNQRMKLFEEIFNKQDSKSIFKK